MQINILSYYLNILFINTYFLLLIPVIYGLHIVRRNKKKDQSQHITILIVQLFHVISLINF